MKYYPVIKDTRTFEKSRPGSSFKLKSMRESLKGEVQARCGSLMKPN